MRYDPRVHHRRSVRLKGFDYSSPNAYYITIATKNKKCLFGSIKGAEMILNHLGRIVEAEWNKTAEIRPEVIVDYFVVMPNHFHSIIIITDETPHCRGTSHVPLSPKSNSKAEQFGKPTPDSIPTIIRWFKSTCTKRIRLFQNSPRLSVWQRGYYEHVIRTEIELDKKREYILNNPLKWEMDRLNPGRKLSENKR